MRWVCRYRDDGLGMGIAVGKFVLVLGVGYVGL
jgi:hypothetical protein